MIYFIGIYLLSGFINYWFLYKADYGQIFDVFLHQLLASKGINENQADHFKRFLIVFPLINTISAYKILKAHI